MNHLLELEIAAYFFVVGVTFARLYPKIYKWMEAGLGLEEIVSTVILSSIVALGWPVLWAVIVVRYGWGLGKYMVKGIKNRSI